MSRPCDNCCVGVKGRQFKQVKMYLALVPDSVCETYPAGRTTTTYLCSPCARELGYK